MQLFFRRVGAADDINYKPVKTLIESLCNCRKVGANLLLNIGPNADGTVSIGICYENKNVYFGLYSNELGAEDARNRFRNEIDF